MSERADFERILASLHDAALDPSLWAGAFALIDEILRVHSTATVFGGGGPAGDIGIQLAWFYARGQRRRDLEREYFQDYYHRDERVPRLRRAPERHVFHVTELFTEEELKASPAYNESMARCQARDGLNVRMDWPGGASLAWLINDPVDGKGWSSGQLDRVRRLLPHVGQAVRVQHTLASAWRTCTVWRTCGWSRRIRSSFPDVQPSRSNGSLTCQKMRESPGPSSRMLIALPARARVFSRWYPRAVLSSSSV